MNESQTQPVETPVSTLLPMLSDEELAQILVMTVDWVHCHAGDLPGFERLGSYFRFRSKAIEF